MTAFHTPRQVEKEVKLLTNTAGLQRAEEWVATQQRQSGSFVFARSHYYYDTSSLELAKSNSTFRKTRGKFNYCLKYPLGVEGLLVIRREVFAKPLDYAIDLHSPIYRRTLIVEALLRLLPALDPIDFKPRVRLDVLRRGRFVLTDDGIDRLFAVMFDNVTALSVSDGRTLASWCELELETGWTWAYPDRRDLLHQYVDKFIALGMSPTTDSKYRLAQLKSCNL